MEKVGKKPYFIFLSVFFVILSGFFIVVNNSSAQTTKTYKCDIAIYEESNCSGEPYMLGKSTCQFVNLNNNCKNKKNGESIAYSNCQIDSSCSNSLENPTNTPIPIKFPTVKVVPSKIPTPKKAYIPPTIRPTFMVTQIVRPSIIDNCPKKSQGDADCNQEINGNDYLLFQNEYTKKTNTTSSDFNRDNKVNLLDFEILRKNIKR